MSAGATGYVELVGVPGLGDASDITINQYVNALYSLAIGIAALLAVLKLIWAGAKYILSDVVTSKESAKKDIYTAILGLVIVISAVLILQTINRDLTDLTVLDRICNQETREGCVDVELPNPPPPDTNPNTNPVVCSAEGGTFSQTISSTICLTGEIVDIGLEELGATTEDDERLLCDRQNLAYNSVLGVCVVRGDNVIPFPVSAVSEMEERMYCSSINADYAPELGGCIPE